MNLETVNAIAQLVAAIGVITSLFYLAAQISSAPRVRLDAEEASKQDAPAKCREISRKYGVANCGGNYH